MENPSSLGYSLHCFSTLAVPCHLSWHLQEQCQRKNRNAQFQSSLHKVLKKAVILHCRKDKIKRIQKVSITGISERSQCPAVQRIGLHRTSIGKTPPCTRNFPWMTSDWIGSLNGTLKNRMAQNSACTKKQSVWSYWTTKPQSLGIFCQLNACGGGQNC